MLEKWGKCLFRVFLVILKQFPCFLHLGTDHVVSIFFFSMYLLSPSSAFHQGVWIYTAYKQCFCFPWNPLQLRDLENYLCGFTNWLLESPEERYVMSNLFMFLILSRNVLVFLPPFSVFPILKKKKMPWESCSQPLSSWEQMFITQSFRYQCLGRF